MDYQKIIHYIKLKIHSGNYRKYFIEYYNSNIYSNLILYSFDRQLNVYQACLPDRMHHLDLGLYKYQVEYTRELLTEWCGSNGVIEFDNRLAKIPRFSGLKLFKHGLGNIKRFTADEFRAMMRQLVFVIDGIIITLHKANYTKNQAKNMDKQLVQLYVDWNKMYIFSCKDKFTESDLKTFKVSVRRYD